MSLGERLARMPMASRLFLSFAAVAALPLLVVPLVIRAVTDSYDRTFAGELEDAGRLVEIEYERLGADLRGRAEKAVEILGPDATQTSGALARTGLDVLTLVDPNGRVQLCAHLPARAGDPDTLSRTLLANAPGVATLAPVVVREGDLLSTRLTLVVAVSLPSGASVVAGRFFGSEQLLRLSQLVQGEVSLSLPGQPPSPDESPRDIRSRLFGQSSVVRELSLPGLRGPYRLRVRLPDDALAETKARIALGAIGTFLLALAVGVALAALLSRRMVGPIGALVEGTRELSKGELRHRVDVKASGELGQLVDAFNGMAGELTQARERLAQAERVAAWQQIARALAHEIKNPLTPIAMAIETLQRTKARSHPDFDRFFEEGTATVLEEVARLGRLATEFGEFARWPKPVPSPAEPEELVSNVLALYQAGPQAERISAEVQPELPRVEVDRDQIQRALVNLVKNAFEAMGDEGKVTVRARRHPDGVALDVVDTGPGLAGGEGEPLFEPYYTTKAEGTGLGLAIVQRIASEHRGRIEFSKTPGGGATFTLVLPALTP